MNLNDYTFERSVEFKEPDGSKSWGRIDLYKRGCFVMEAKQSREKDRPKALVLAGQPDLFVPDAQPRGQRSANRVWDQLMIGARHQAQEYARALPASHGWPPFVLVCDVGHCIDGELRLARVTRQHLAPGQGRELRDAQRAVVGDLKQKAVAARLGGAEQEVGVDLGQQPLR